MTGSADFAASRRSLAARGLTDGAAEGELVVLEAPLSLWGGFDVERGTIIDVTHPQSAVALSNRVVAMRTARGSSSSSSALVEAVRRGTAPSAIILTRPDPILVIGSLVAADLYGRELPIVIVCDDDWPQLGESTRVTVESRGGMATITKRLLAERPDPVPTFRS